MSASDATRHEYRRETRKDERDERGDGEGDRDDDEDETVDEMTKGEKIRLGRMIKSLVDQGRLEYLRSRANGRTRRGVRRADDVAGESSAGGARREDVQTVTVTVRNARARDAIRGARARRRSRLSPGGLPNQRGPWSARARRTVVVGRVARGRVASAIAGAAARRLRARSPRPCRLRRRRGSSRRRLLRRLSNPRPGSNPPPPRPSERRRFASLSPALSSSRRRLSPPRSRPPPPPPPPTAARRAARSVADRARAATPISSLDRSGSRARALAGLDHPYRRAHRHRLAAAAAATTAAAAAAAASFPSAAAVLALRLIWSA